ncbi:MAG: poly(3-hydroxybutyrate) depolymerase [Gammaproteobacteria bacterium]|nr:poly(3-hydroxybutyrate) depolymerase [Gammaproteobacteria bacterium]
MSNTSYPEKVTHACAPGARIGATGKTDELLTERGLRYFVRTPLNYDNRIAHPLMMVFSPGDRSGLGTEWFTGLTTEGTRQGFVVVYADNRPRQIPALNRPLAKEWILELGTIPALVATQWCIDLDRVFLTGHSNGGTISTALALLEESPLSPAAIAPSAAGFRGEDLNSFACPAPLPVLVMHSRNDKVFPGYGAETMQWWKQCNQCPERVRSLGDNCISYLGCAENVSTVYCEGERRHTVWPERNNRIISLFTGAQ